MPKPKKPYKSFPLTPQARGGWAKKYQGHQLYIRDRDPDRALARFHRIAKRIDQGEPIGPQKAMDDATVYDVTNRYVLERQAERDTGTLSDGAWRDYRDAANEMCEAFGEDTPVDELKPDDFTRLYWKLEKRLKPHALGRMIQGCRSIWKHAVDNDWIRHRPRYGSVFKKPTTEKKEGRPYTLDECRWLIACAVGSQVEAMLLVMLNGGYTAKDCADLPRSAVDLELGIINFPRPKMRRRRPVDRVMTLWPETAEALAEVMAARPDDPLVFRTVHGNAWVNGQTDAVGQAVGYIIEDLRPKPDAKGKRRPSRWNDAGGPSWIRHVHRTIADQLEKPHAAARLMGHRIKGIADVYIDSIEHERIQQITDHIRSKIWPDAPARQAPSGTSPTHGAA